MVGWEGGNTNISSRASSIRAMLSMKEIGLILLEWEINAVKGQSHRILDYRYILGFGKLMLNFLKVLHFTLFNNFFNYSYENT